MDKLKMKIAEDAIRKIAADSGESVESVRRNIQIAMVNGLASTDADVQRFWQSVPREGELPTPEELILYIAEVAMDKGENYGGAPLAPLLGSEAAARRDAVGVAD